MEKNILMDICKHNEFCGGCIYQGIPYEQQLKAKNSEVLNLFRAKSIEPLVYDEIEGCPNQYRYRNKMEYTFGDFIKDGELCLGMHKKKNFMSIITVDDCQLVDEDFNIILSFVLEFAKEREYKHYHKKSHQGLLRNLIVRKGVRSKEILVNIVTSSEEGFDEIEFVDGLQKLVLCNHIVGVLRTFNDNIGDAVNPERVEILWGQDFYMEEILGLKFKVSAFSFFQTNIQAVERLYSEALALIDDVEGKNVFDLYCGTGTISQVLALKAAKVLGIEIVEEAVEAAKVNAKLNGLDNCNFIAGDVFEVLKEVDEKPDVIVVDPPRVGMSTKAVDKIVSYEIPQILYISCNPKTLAINLEQFDFYGYNVQYAKAFDNFPGTKHTECVVLLSRQKA
ncbi:MAG: 23S rRNA (uracil(1939)-C(5))-methyltransferase RlmD [Anaerovoracaceae bacterium]